MSRDPGFAPDPTKPMAPPSKSCERESRLPISPIELIATAALAVSILIAVTAISIGIARADALGGLVAAGRASFVVVPLAGSRAQGD